MPDVDPPPETPVPASFGEAITRRDVMGPTDTGGDPLLSKYRYYETPIRRFLRACGAPREDLDDLVQEALLLLHLKVLPGYDPARGPFRPYFKQALRNLLNEHLRKMQREALPEPAELERRMADAGGDEVDDGLLAERLRAIFDRYMREAVPDSDQAEAEVLAARLSGEGQREVAARIGRSERWVRALQERAAERFWAWAHDRFHPDDWARLVPSDLAAPDSGSRLVRWLSRKKRRELAAVLIALFSKSDPDASV